MRFKTRFLNHILLKMTLNGVGSTLIIGISGVTCGGKTTTSTELNNILPNSKVFSQDDYFLGVDDPRHIWIPELNHINFDVLTSLDMKRMHEDILSYVRSNNLKKVNVLDKANFESNEVQYGDIRKFVHNKIKESRLTVVIVEGFSIFNYKPMLNLFDLKYYFGLKKDECYRRRETRVYDPPDCPGYFEMCVWPEYLNQLHDVKTNVKNITYFDEDSENVVETILVNITC